jgi:hypothetical protein
MNRNHFASAGVVLTMTFICSDAYAYVDPGTGSILIQWLFGMAMASFAVLSVYWQQAKGFFSRMFVRATAGRSPETGTGADDKGHD